MKRLGKFVVHELNTSDGQFGSYFLRTRVVYEKADGTKWINWLSGYRELMDCAGNLVLHVNSVTIKSESIENMLARVFATGGNIYTISE